MTTYLIHTQADTRSKARQNMSHEIAAASEEDAVYEARKRHIDKAGWNASVWVVSVSVAA